jgi:ribose transport system ATP-binding protein
MNQLKKQGIAVMFVSSEMPEVLGIADRVIVMCDGRITGEVIAKETTQNEVLKFATEFEQKKAVG